MESAEYEIMFRMEEAHWWYRALHRLIFWELAAQVPDWKNKAILDAGCGTGAILQKLGNPEKHVGIDLAPEAIAFCKKRGLENVKQANIMELPFRDETFEAVICSSVLYHRWVTDVPKALRELHRVLKPGGVMVLNLPAFEFLRSPHDDAVFTAQRFTKKTACSLLEAQQFQVRHATYWTSMLFPLAILARTFGGSKKGRDFEEDAPKSFQNKVFNGVMNVEFRLLRMIPLPFGVALLCVARKKA